TYSNFYIIHESSQVSLVISVKRNIDKLSPGNIDLYSQNQSERIGYTLYYLYLMEGRISESGHKIGVCDNRLLKDARGIDSKWSCPDQVEQLDRNDTYSSYDLEKINNGDLNKLGFKRVRAEDIQNKLYDLYKK